MIKTLVTITLSIFTVAVLGTVTLGFVFPSAKLPAQESQVVPAGQNGAVSLPAGGSNNSRATGGATSAGASAPSEPSVNYYTQIEVSRHNSPSNCWLSVEKKVYDVSGYLGGHPGGRSAITSNCGKEVTGLFASIHSNRAWDLLGKYQVGFIGAPAVAGSNTVAGDSKTQGDISANIQQNFNVAESAVLKKYPEADIIKTQPQGKNAFIVKFSNNGSLNEAHVDKSGKITKEEVENDEYDWDFWSEDEDDASDY